MNYSFYLLVGCLGFLVFFSSRISVARVVIYSTVVRLNSSDEQLTYKKISLCVRSSMKLNCYAWLLSSHLE